MIYWNLGQTQIAGHQRKSHDMMECSSHTKDTNDNYLWPETEEFLFYHKLFNAESLSVVLFYVLTFIPLFINDPGLSLEFLLQAYFYFMLFLDRSQICQWMYWFWSLFSISFMPMTTIFLFLSSLFLLILISIYKESNNERGMSKK